MQTPVCRSPTKNVFEFENFLSNFETVLSGATSCNSLFALIIYDFNATFSARDKTATEGTQLESFATFHGFYQLISQLTHLLLQTSCKWLQKATTLVSVIAKGKEDYRNIITSKLRNPKANAKTYWSILKIFYNGKTNPGIPPLIINNKLVSNFKMKVNYLNSFIFCISLYPIR